MVDLEVVFIYLVNNIYNKIYSPENKYNK